MHDFLEWWITLTSCLPWWRHVQPSICQEKEVWHLLQHVNKSKVQPSSDTFIFIKLNDIKRREWLPCQFEAVRQESAHSVKTALLSHKNCTHTIQQAHIQCMCGSVWKAAAPSSQGAQEAQDNTEASCRVQLQNVPSTAACLRAGLAPDWTHNISARLGIYNSGKLQLHNTNSWVSSGGSLHWLD